MVNLLVRGALGSVLAIGLAASVGGCNTVEGFGKDMSAYSFEEYTQVKHVMFDNTAVVRKDWHRTVFGDR